MSERKTTQEEQEVLVYLNDLRDSGDTNMYGASPYVELQFNMTRREARTLVSLWMNNFKENSDYSTVKD